MIGEEHVNKVVEVLLIRPVSGNHRMVYCYEIIYCSVYHSISIIYMCRLEFLNDTFHRKPGSLICLSPEPVKCNILEYLIRTFEILPWDRYPYLIHVSCTPDKDGKDIRIPWKRKSYLTHVILPRTACNVIM